MTDIKRRMADFLIENSNPSIKYRVFSEVLHEELPDNGGQWNMVCNDRGVAVFVWMGVEDASGHTCKTPSQLRGLISQASLALARQLHAYARSALRKTTSSDKRS